MTKNKEDKYQIDIEIVEVEKISKQFKTMRLARKNIKKVILTKLNKTCGEC